MNKRQHRKSKEDFLSTVKNIGLLFQALDNDAYVSEIEMMNEQMFTSTGEPELKIDSFGVLHILVNGMWEPVGADKFEQIGLLGPCFKVGNMVVTPEYLHRQSTIRLSYWICTALRISSVMKEAAKEVDEYRKLVDTKLSEIITRRSMSKTRKRKMKHEQEEA